MPAPLFAAKSAVGPPITELEVALLSEGDESWTKEPLPRLLDRIRERARDLSNPLGGADWLDGERSPTTRCQRCRKCGCLERQSSTVCPHSTLVVGNSLSNSVWRCLAQLACQCQLLELE